MTLRRMTVHEFNDRVSGRRCPRCKSKQWAYYIREHFTETGKTMIHWGCLTAAEQALIQLQELGTVVTMSDPPTQGETHEQAR